MPNTRFLTALGINPRLKFLKPHLHHFAKKFAHRGSHHTQKHSASHHGLAMQLHGGNAVGGSVSHALKKRMLKPIKFLM